MLRGDGRQPDGERDVLGLWFPETKGAKFWLRVLTDLKPAASPTSSSAASTAHRLPGGDRGHLPARDDQNLPRPSGPLSHALHPLQDRRPVAARPEEDLHRRRRSTPPRLPTFAENGPPLPDDLSRSWLEHSKQSRHSSRSPQTSAGSSTPRTRSKPSTARSARSSRRRATSRPRTRPAS